MQPTTTHRPRRSGRTWRVAGCAVLALALVSGTWGADGSASAATRKKVTRKTVKRTVTTRPPFTPPPTTAAPAPVPLPPVTAAPVTTVAPTTTAPRNFVIGFDVPSVTVRPGDTAAVPLTVTRAGWTGPVDLTVVDTGTGLSANLAPNPTSASTVLYVRTTAATASGDYRIAVVGFVGTSVRYAEAVVKVRGTESVVVTRTQLSATAARGSSVHLYANVQVINNFDGTPASITLTGAPAYTAITNIAWSVNGDVDVTLLVSGSVVPGTYENMTLVASKGGSNQGVVIPLTVT